VSGADSKARGSWAPARLLNDLAHTFVHVVESQDDRRARLLHGLDLLRQIVPYDRCALLDVTPGLERRLITAPPAAEADEAALAAMLDELLALLSDRHDKPTANGAQRGGPSPRSWGAHLAVPLVGLDQVIGVLFVARADAPYGEEDLCLLSVVAAQIAAYLTTLRLHHEKDEFIATLSHELRTPLTAVVGYAALLRAGSLANINRERAVDAIARNATTLTRLTEDLLDLSRIATGKLRVERKPITAAQVVEVCVDAARPQAESRAIHLELVIDGAARMLLGDAERLQQVVLNLLMNAIKFTPRGGKIGVRVEHGADHVDIEVRDTGKGISPDFLPYVFDRSRQATSSSRRGADGLGLGLSIVRSLVKLHGGRVRAESEGPGRGSTFTVMLPLLVEGAEEDAFTRPTPTPM
jgi:signal transduction histidine kinase